MLNGSEMYLSCKCLHGMFVWAKIIMTTVLQEKGTIFERMLNSRW